jgi:hypothetical protein
MTKIIKNIVLFSICLLLSGCYLFSDSRSKVTINLDEMFKNQIALGYIHFGGEKCQVVRLKPGESFSTLFFPILDSNCHLDFGFNIGNTRYEWASWESELFKKSFADAFFKQHNRYKIIIDLKSDSTLFIRVYQSDGLFSKKLIVQGRDKVYYRPLE